MHRRDNFRASVIALALAIFGITAVCPGQCVFAARTAPGGDCHGDEGAPSPDASSPLPCCASVVVRKVSADADAGPGAPILVPVRFPVKSFSRTAAAVVARSASSHSPPAAALYLRSHALLI